MPTAIAAVMVGADGRKHAVVRQGEGDHLLHDSQDEFGAGGDVQFLKQSIQVRVRGVGGNAKATGNGSFVEIVKDGPNDLQLALCDVEGGSNLKPSVIAEHGSAEQLQWLAW